FDGIDAITASGLGGGSLIYANVMLEKPEGWFTQPIPDGTGEETWSFSHEDLAPHYEKVFDVLRVKPMPTQFVGTESLKTQRFLDASPDATLAPLAVRFLVGDTPVVGAPLPEESYGNIHGKVQRTTCQMRGECDVGCNVGAKSSMDHTYLSMADSDGAAICILTEVRAIRRIEDSTGHLFEVGYVVHSEKPDAHHCTTDDELRWIRARRVVLAAGTLNTTYLMLSNAAELGMPSDSPVGTRFCGNGDLLGFAMPPLGGRPLLPSAGPVITAYQQFDDGDHRILLQDGGLPNLGSWNWDWREIKSVMEKLFREWWDRTTKGSQGLTPASEDFFEFPRLHWPLPLLGMGVDKPDGRLTLENGKMKCCWTVDTSRSHFNEVLSQMSVLSERLSARFCGDPQWQLDRVVTVHPLGGCPTDTTAEEGVVDSYGRVRSVPGLWIADGSVMPGPIGANPSLTIAAFAHRAAEELLKERVIEVGTPSAPEPFTASD
ncbi:MAG TPA: GMC oxidoreductase, partial [Mycobacterium sp.]